VRGESKIRKARKTKPDAGCSILDAGNHFSYQRSAISLQHEAFSVLAESCVLMAVCTDYDSRIG